MPPRRAISSRKRSVTCALNASIAAGVGNDLTGLRTWPPQGYVPARGDVAVCVGYLSQDKRRPSRLMKAIQLSGSEAA